MGLVSCNSNANVFFIALQELSEFTTLFFIVIFIATYFSFANTKELSGIVAGAPKLDPSKDGIEFSSASEPN